MQPRSIINCLDALLYVYTTVAPYNGRKLQQFTSRLTMHIIAPMILTRAYEECQHYGEVEDVPTNLPEYPEAVMPLEENLKDESCQESIVEYVK